MLGGRTNLQPPENREHLTYEGRLRGNRLIGIGQLRYLGFCDAVARLSDGLRKNFSFHG